MISAALKLAIIQQREKIDMEYRHENDRLKINGKSLVYSNQKVAAVDCIEHFNEGKNLVLLVAQPGTGKTGTVLEFLKYLTTHNDDEKCVLTKDIHIMSGMNDTDWQHQFKKKMLPSFRENIHHRGVLNKKIEDIAAIKNGILITDECHIASEKSMTVSKVMRAAGLTDCVVANARNVKLFDISATPESVGWDITSWGDKAATVCLEPGENYKGFEVMLSEGRICEAKPFNNYDNVKEWFQFFQDRYAGTSKKYFPMRVSNYEWLGNIRRAIVDFGWDEMSHNSEERIENIDDLMSHAPSKHTIIFIKDFWRASKRLVRTHVGGSYEQVPKTRNVTTASQSTIGRFCDNYEYEGEELNPDLRPVHFGDKISIIAYVKWFKEGCDYRKVNYSSSRIQSSDGHVKAKASKIHPSNISHLNAVAIPNADPDVHKRVPVIAEVPVEIINILAAKGAKKTTKTKKIIEILRENYKENPSYTEFLEVISTTECFQISTPGEETVRSYRMHILDVVGASEENRKYGIMDSPTKPVKSKSCWQAYIDTRLNRLCILWQVFPEETAAAIDEESMSTNI